MEADGVLDDIETPDDQAAREQFDETIALAAAGKFDELGWDDRPLGELQPTTIDDFLNSA